ncbi:MAG: peptide deformylase [Gemmatimonadaceae bacterium]
MSRLDIHVFGSPLLREETRPVEAITAGIRQLADDMFETMYAAQGIGLAAPQVGRLERLAVLDVDGHRLALINPEIVESRGAAKGEEGCLSMPDVYGDVERPTHVRVRALDIEGAQFEVDADDLFARCLQHEIDHLHGKLFIDYLSVLRRRAALAKWATMKGQYPGGLRKVDPSTIATHHHRDEEL